VLVSVRNEILSEPGVYVVIVPDASTVLVDIVDFDELVTAVAGSVVVVVVEEVCAKAVASAIALTVPAANNVVNLFCFMFVLCFG
jgi:hypothetical protein